MSPIAASALVNKRVACGEASPLSAQIEYDKSERAGRLQQPTRPDHKSEGTGPMAIDPSITGADPRAISPGNDNFKFDPSKWGGRDNCYVYLIAAETKFHVSEDETGWNPKELIKVGISSNPHGRIAGFQTASPFKLRLVSVWRMLNRSDALWIEKKFHHRNRRYRTAGEWFRYDVTAALCAIDSTIAEWWIEHAVRNFGGAVEFLEFTGISHEQAQLTLCACYGPLNPETDEQFDSDMVGADEECPS
jgi:hypothetical protein